MFAVTRRRLRALGSAAVASAVISAGAAAPAAALDNRGTHRAAPAHGSTGPVHGSIAHHPVSMPPGGRPAPAELLTRSGVLVPPDGPKLPPPPPGMQLGTTVSARVSAERSQTVLGFGASGAWWPAEIDQFPAEAQAQVASMLFGTDGIQLSRYRYNIGGGGTGVSVWWKAAPTFYLAGSGSYNWNADPNGVRWLQLAAGFGVPTLEAFSNSAPSLWTSDHRSCGGVLEPGALKAYAAYLASVVTYLDTLPGVHVNEVSPVNEPDGSQRTCLQEGMAVPMSERGPLMVDVAAALRSRHARAGVIADESSEIHDLLVEAPHWLDQPAVRKAVVAVAHHGYDYPSTPVLAELSRLGAPHQASEICCYNGAGFGWGYDPTMTSGLWLASTIYSDLAVAHDSSFDWWTALSGSIGCSPGADPGCQGRWQTRGRNDALVYFDPNYAADHNYQLFPTKRFYVLGQFSRYVRPGAVLHEVTGLPPGLEAVAFFQNRTWTVVVVNDGAARRVELSLPVSTGAHLIPEPSVTTDAELNLEPTAAPSVTRGTLAGVVQADSVTTFQLKVVTN